MSPCLHPLFGPPFTPYPPLSVVSAKQGNLIKSQYEMQHRKFNQISVVCEGGFFFGLHWCASFFGTIRRNQFLPLYPPGLISPHKRTDNSWQKVALITQPLMHAMNNIFPMILKPSSSYNQVKDLIPQTIACWSSFIPIFGTRSGQMHG